MREVDWDNYGPRVEEVTSEPTAIKEAGGDPKQILEELRKGCNVPIEAFLNWLDWFDYKLTRGGGGIEELKFGALLDLYIHETKDPGIREKLEGPSSYWIYATPEHPSTSGDVVL